MSIMALSKIERDMVELEKIRQNMDILQNRARDIANGIIAENLFLTLASEDEKAFVDKMLMIAETIHIALYGETTTEEVIVTDPPIDVTEENHV